MKIDWIERRVVRQLTAEVGDYRATVIEEREGGMTNYRWIIRRISTDRQLDNWGADSLADAKRQATAALAKRLKS